MFSEFSKILQPIEFIILRTTLIMIFLGTTLLPGSNSGSFEKVVMFAAAVNSLVT